MIREEILEKLTNELSTFIYQVEDPRELIHTYLNYALDIGIFHLFKDAKEVAKLDLQGNIIKIYRSSSDAAAKNKISEGNIRSVIANRRRKAGGFLWKNYQNNNKLNNLNYGCKGNEIDEPSTVAIR